MMNVPPEQTVMSKRLDCIVDGCHATVEADSADAVMEEAEAHAREAHPELELDEATVRSLRSNIREV